MHQPSKNGFVVCGEGDGWNLKFWYEVKMYTYELDKKVLQEKR